MILKVWTMLPSGKTTSLIAKIFEQKGDQMTIRYLSPTDDRDHGCIVWRYEDQVYEIDDDSVMEYTGTDDEGDIGFKKTNDGGFIKYDSDSDYVPSDEDESDGEEDEESNESDFSVDEE
jgi:hypothetical protein